MTLTRETVAKLLADGLIVALRSGDQADMDGCRVKVSREACETAAETMEALATALLAAWDERDVLLNRAFDEGQILAALRDCDAERDAMRAALGADDKMISEITEDVVRWKRRAEAAEGELVVTDKLLLTKTQQSLDRLARAEAADAEIVELNLNATARDVRIFELREELDNAEAKLAERDAEVARLREALTPSGDTKAEYSGEFSVRVYDIDEDENEVPRDVLVDWTTIKAIMTTISARAALNKEPKT